MSRQFTTTANHIGQRQAALNLMGRMVWHGPRPFAMARCLGQQYSLRCVLFHDIRDAESSFTRGLGITVTRKTFEAALNFVLKHYTPVSLQDVIAHLDGGELPPRPILLTFDDAYASVREFAAPLCSELGVPAAIFLNGEFLDNGRLSLENLVCYVANVFGVGTINAAIRSLPRAGHLQVRSLIEVFSRFLPQTSLPGRETFRTALAQFAGISESALAAEAGLYLTSQQLRELSDFGFEIGNHTYSHVNCRILSKAEFAEEIDRNTAVLERASGMRVRSFSVPYGSSSDLSFELVSHLDDSGYDAIFLAEGRANSSCKRGSCLDRISIKADTDAALFSEMEILPRLRALRNLLGFAVYRESRSATSELPTLIRTRSRITP